MKRLKETEKKRDLNVIWNSKLNVTLPHVSIEKGGKREGRKRTRERKREREGKRCDVDEREDCYS